MERGDYNRGGGAEPRSRARAWERDMVLCMCVCMDLPEKLFAGDRWREHNMIFPSVIGTPLEPRNLYRHFVKLLEDVDLPKIRFHDLRHTAATLMFQNGAHPKIVQERLGHASISLTLDTYSHVIPSLQNDIAEKLDKTLDK